MLRRILGRRRDGVAGGARKLHNEEGYLARIVKREMHVDYGLESLKGKATT
jgi:hypothetical protein